MANWLAQINIAEKWAESDEDESKIPELVNDIITKLDEVFKTKDEELQSIIAGFKAIPKDYEEFNIWMEKLFNWADTGHRLFINWMFPRKKDE